ncbi:MAG: glycoside hydrolase family 31 protein [Caulobacteraceae bacterium]
MELVTGPSIARPPVFRLERNEGARLRFSSDKGYSADIFVLEDAIIRVLITPPGGLSGLNTWSIAPGAEDVPSKGRDRFDLKGFTCPEYRLAEADGHLVLETDALRLSLRLEGFSCRWEMHSAAGWAPIARDRPTQAYDFGWWGGKPAHFLALDPREKYFGLGERSGPMDRAGRRFELRNVDAMGYDAERDDPLYKHIPFYMTCRPDLGTAFGLFYDAHATCVFDFGAERSNYHGRFRLFRAEAGDLDYYVIAGPSPADVTRRFTWLTGRPAHLPKWALGYSGSTMSYTDAPDAQAQMARFIENCREHDILCDSFHLSSGYTSIGPRRYVFHWNRDKFPDPAAFAASYREAGIRLVANIKPCLLDDHPLFEEARAQGLLISEPDGEPSWCQFWDGVGAYLDFSNPKAAAWWRQHVTADLLDMGITATWNDNNEFEVTSPTALANQFGAPRPARDTLPVQTMLMLQASRRAQLTHAPDTRPFLVSRSGAAGMQRYVQTWSGDNFTAWETLKWNIPMGLGLALSGVSNSGHDIGGFAGPRPGPDLFLRWVAAGIFMPRFSIHSWNDDQTANEPWMFGEDFTDDIRGMIKLRYQLIPTLYDLAWRHHSDFEPIIRPLFHDFPDDLAAYEETSDFLLGPNLLVGSVVERGERDHILRLPAGSTWQNYWTGAAFKGGQTVSLPNYYTRPPLLVREGSAIALNIADQSFDRRADHRAFAIFAPPLWVFETTCYEDDGESEAWRRGEIGRWRLEIEALPHEIVVGVHAEGQRPPSGPVTLLIRPSDRRPVTLRNGRITAEAEDVEWRRFEVNL